MEEFVRYYTALYSPIPTYEASSLETLLNGLKLLMLMLNNSENAILEANITSLEIKAAISAFPI